MQDHNFAVIHHTLEYMEVADLQHLQVDPTEYTQLLVCREDLQPIKIFCKNDCKHQVEKFYTQTV